MNRIKKGVTKRKRHKKILKQCKGFTGRAKNCFTIGNRILQRAYNYRFASGKTKKQNKKRHFIQIINAFCRNKNNKYSTFIHKFNKHKIKNKLDRKSFSIVIQHDKNMAEKIYNDVVNDN